MFVALFLAHGVDRIWWCYLFRCLSGTSKAPPQLSRPGFFSQLHQKILRLGPIGRKSKAQSRGHLEPPERPNPLEIKQQSRLFIIRQNHNPQNKSPTIFHSFFTAYLKVSIFRGKQSWRNVSTHLIFCDIPLFPKIKFCFWSPFHPRFSVIHR